MRLFKSQRGDTIVEVLIVVAMLGLILTISFILTNRSTQGNRQAQERSEAAKHAESQIELLQAYLEQGTASTLPNSGSNFCMKRVPGPNDTEKVEITAPIPNVEEFNNFDNPSWAECKKNDLYNVYIERRSNNLFVAHTKWYKVGGNGVDEATMAHKLYPELVASGPSGTTVAANCAAGTYRLAAGAPCNQVCTPPSTSNAGYNEGSDSCYVPQPPPTVAFSVTPGAHNFNSRHLFYTGGNYETISITVSPSGGISRVGNVTLSDPQNSFTKLSDTCSGQTLPPGSNCNVTVQFNPPSGPSFNRYSNQNPRNATLNLPNADGKGDKTVTLSGKTYSDRLGPGDSITQAGDPESGPVAYKGCYKNVEACGLALTGIQGDGNFALGGQYCVWGGNTASAPYGGGHILAMQPDGNLVFYGIYGSVRYASYLYGSDNWLQVYNDNGVAVTNGSGGPQMLVVRDPNGCKI